MNINVSTIQAIKTLSQAQEHLFEELEQTPRMMAALTFAQKAHEGQTRKSGEPYIIHPILVASIVSRLSKSEDMAIAALLHDVVEDTAYSLEDIEEMYGQDVAHLVGGLTKIDDIRDEKLIPSTSNEKLITSALTFRKMLLHSIKDVRVLVIKLCDRLHNMMTLDALPVRKQERISEETLVVYAPVAHRLGISSIKNYLEDLCFKYLFKKEHQKLELYLKENHQSLKIKLNSFIENLKQEIIKNGFRHDDFELIGRIKHNYSIFQKSQRKGIGPDEILDLMAVRVLVKEPVDCYKVLGIVHLHYRPLTARFKDYIAVAKDNGYQTIHTTVFDNASIFEVQIRTYEMHKTAEFGVASHWSYKNGLSNKSNINLDWLGNLQYQNESIEESYELQKNDLYSDEITVFSPKGKQFTLPRGALALDFAYAVHSEIGDNAKRAYINKEKATLLTELKNGDIVKIETIHKAIARCSWIDAVKTSRAKTHMRTLCRNRVREVDMLSGMNIIKTILGLNEDRIKEWLDSIDSYANLNLIARDAAYLSDILNRYLNELKKNHRFSNFLRRHRFKLKKYSFGAVDVYSNYYIADVIFDFCCHPRKGDEIIAFKVNNKVHVHHKLCDKARSFLEEKREMVYISWSEERIFRYHLIVSLFNAKGSLSKFLQHLSKLDINVVSIELGKGESERMHFCDLEIECEEKDITKLKKVIEKKNRVIQLVNIDDAYKRGKNG